MMKLFMITENWNVVIEQYEDGIWAKYWNITPKGYDWVALLLALSASNKWTVRLTLEDGKINEEDHDLWQIWTDAGL